MSREDPQVRVRLTPELKSMLMAAAKANSRTFNAEVSARLAASFNCETESKPTQVSAEFSSYAHELILISIRDELSALTAHLGVKRQR